MALVTVQRSPSPHKPEAELEEEADGSPRSRQRKSRRSQRSLKKLMTTVNTIRFVNRLRFSESYFTIKGAAIILPKSSQLPTSKKQRTRSKSSIQACDIQTHLQCMFKELRAEDTVQVAIKLESPTSFIRYLAIVVTGETDGHQESVIIGFHCSDHAAHIGLVLPIYRNTEVVLDGDGGFRIVTEERYHIFKPVGVQAMWSAWMTFTKICSIAQNNNHKRGGSTHSWLPHYTDRMTADQSMINEWNELDDLMVRREDSTANLLNLDDTDSLEIKIRTHLRELMEGCELEDLTAYDMRMQLEKILDTPLRNYRKFIDQEMMLIIRQLDTASQIFDFLYLGSEWNASNLQDLQSTGVGYILNVTKEIDNFFPGSFEYKNIRQYDEENVNLMQYWEHTHRFICKARDNNSKVLVHCKMGVSRSAATVIAFAMKEYGWSLEHAMDGVKSKRAVIKPNDSFMQQLQTYEGILNASKHRWNPMFKCEADQQDEKGACAQMDGADSLATSDQLHDSADNGAQKDINNATFTHNLVKQDDSPGEEGDDFNSTDSDSDYTGSDTCSSSSTVSYELLEDEPVFISTPDDEQAVIGLHYSKLNTDLTSTTTQSNVSNPSAMGAMECPDITDKGEESPFSQPSLQTETSDMCDLKPPIIEADGTDTAAYSAVADDVSVCYGVVQKTKEQIAVGVPQNQTVISRTEVPVPVTPGTVRKVLGKIEQKSPEDNVLSRSRSLKLDRRKLPTDSDAVFRSASVRVKTTSQPPAADLTAELTAELAPASSGSPCAEKDLNSNTPELFDSSSKLQQKCGEEPVKFSIGEDCISSDSPETSDTLAPISRHNISKDHPTDSSLSQGTAHTDCMLKVASRPLFASGGEMVESEEVDCSNPVHVRALVGAFEDIGSTGLTRPLTIHVDSFSSDPFAHKSSASEVLSPLQRSQSLRVIKSKQESNLSTDSDKPFGIRNVTSSTQKVLQPYWKIKRENTKKLQHSFSTAAMRSKDVL